MNKYLNSGKDIESPEQMMSAMESFEGIPGLKVVVCSLLPSAGCVAGKWDGVSLINNREYADKTMKVWLAYNTGPGKVLPLSDFVLPLSVPRIIHKNETEGVVSFVKVKARIRKRKIHLKLTTKQNVEVTSNPVFPATCFHAPNKAVLSHTKGTLLSKNICIAEAITTL